ncbi:MAG: RluA family pseudouridine synthase [Planctomycetes bacterium]|nr:RluA family pseudouridine synthase [Planctomycetota bacterium]
MSSARPSPQRELTILARTDRWLVLDKPAGVASVPGGGADHDLLELCARQGLEVLAVHRLDRDTSGAILFALDREARDRFEALFRERDLAKTYWALALGRVTPPVGAWKFPLLEERGFTRVSALGKKSETRYRTLAHHGQTTELELELVTGRMNQIRVHAAHSGFPLAGERKYARGGDDPTKAKRLALHSWRLGFRDPWSGADVVIEAPLPLDLVDLRERAARVRGAVDRDRSPQRDAARSTARTERATHGRRRDPTQRRSDRRKQR